MKEAEGASLQIAEDAQGLFIRALGRVRAADCVSLRDEVQSPP